MHQLTDSLQPDPTSIISSYDAALSRAAWRRLGVRLVGGCNELVALADIEHALNNKQPVDRGMQVIPLDRIVGSLNRAHDYDLHFMPHHRERDGRWQRVAQAVSRGIDLPPVQLIRIQDAFFVVDGHHRVSVAAARGYTVIDAQVSEVEGTHLTVKAKCSRLGFRVDSGSVG